VYKCANQYSDTPCPQAVVVNTDDARSSTEKMQADASTKNTAAAGKELEKKRLAQNAVSVNKAPKPQARKARPEPEKKPLVLLKKPKLQSKEKSDAFVSQVPPAKAIPP
jgi:HD superfamily phosphohydrolase